MDGLLQHFGGAVAIIVALVGWLGVLWRDRILDRERAQHAPALQDERHKNDAELTRVRQALDIAREAAGRVHADKLSAYRVAGDVIAATLATFSDAAIGNLTPD